MKRLRPPGVRRPWGPIVLLLAFGTACFGTVLFGSQDAGGTETVDPFYERLFQDGSLSLSMGDAAEASRQLRLGCFGMLGTPRRLGDCLTRLAVADATLEDRDAFIATLTRILEVERRFAGYSKAAVPPQLRREFEARVEAWAPAASLLGLEVFSDIADRQRAAALRQLPAEERRGQLDILIAQAPAKPVWRQLEVELELESGNPQRASELAERLDVGRPGVACLRGRAQADLGSCDDDTLAELRSCRDGAARPAAAALLACHVQVGDREAGEAVLAAMDEAQRREPAIRRLARSLRRIDRAPDPPAAASVEQTAEPSGDTEPPPAQFPAAQSQPNQAELATLDRSWQILRADDRSRFDSTFATVTSLAQSYSGWAEAQHLAAELAYRLSLWQDSVSYFERAEAVSPLQPDQEFYLAVALFKSGQQAAAEARLEQCLPSIQSSDFVRFWTERIRSGS